MDLNLLTRKSDVEWWIEKHAGMHVPGILYASEALVKDMDAKVYEQVTNVARLPGIERASYAMPDAHWGYGFPIGGVAAFDADLGGVVSAGGVGFDISCGVRLLTTGLAMHDIEPILERIEEHGCMADAEPEEVSGHAKNRQRDEMGTLGSGNHYLEVQQVTEILDPAAAAAFELKAGDIVVSIHCGSRGLGHQIGTEFLRRMVLDAPSYGIDLPDRELACAPINSPLGQAYLGAMRAAINCALANRQIITGLVRRTFAEIAPAANLKLLYDVSHNTCKVETHKVNGQNRRLFVHRKGATRAFGPGHPDLPPAFASIGQPVLIGGTMGTASYVLVGTSDALTRSFGSACHGAGRSMSRHAALKQWRGRQVIEELAARGILIRSPSPRGAAEEAPGAYKDVTAVVDAADRAGLSRKVARLEPLVCIKG
jgi:tRNA-splicing ligase RtcB